MKSEMDLKTGLTIVKEDDIKHLLEPGEVGATFELIVSDTKTGKITEHRPQEKSKSFVQQFLELVWMRALPVNENLMYAPHDTSAPPGVLHNIPDTLQILAANAPINVDTWGIQIGTDDTAALITNNCLGAKIPHNPAAVSYSVTAFGAPASDATTSQFTMTRNFSNAGGAITVKEIGLVVKGTRYLTTIYYFLTIRDVPLGGIVLPNGQTLTVNYRPQCVI